MACGEEVGDLSGEGVDGVLLAVSDDFHLVEVLKILDVVFSDHPHSVLNVPQLHHLPSPPSLYHPMHLVNLTPLRSVSPSIAPQSPSELDWVFTGVVASESFLDLDSREGDVGIQKDDLFLLDLLLALL